MGKRLVFDGPAFAEGVNAHGAKFHVYYQDLARPLFGACSAATVPADLSWSEIATRVSEPNEFAPGLDLAGWSCSISRGFDGTRWYERVRLTDPASGSVRDFFSVQPDDIWAEVEVVFGATVEVGRVRLADSYVTRGFARLVIEADAPIVSASPERTDVEEAPATDEAH